MKSEDSNLQIFNNEPDVVSLLISKQVLSRSNRSNYQQFCMTGFIKLMDAVRKLDVSAEFGMEATQLTP